MRYCEKCGNPIPDGQKFCSQCGEPLRDANPFEEILNPTSPAKIKKEPLHQRTWFVILWCILLPPIGMILTWIKKDWDIETKKKVLIITGIWFVFILISNAFM